MREERTRLRRPRRPAAVSWPPCAPRKEVDPHARIAAGRGRLQGPRAALDDCRNHNAVILVHRAVKPGETDPQTGLPLRDAGLELRDGSEVDAVFGLQLNFDQVIASKRQHFDQRSDPYHKVAATPEAT